MNTISKEGRDTGMILAVLQARCSSVRFPGKVLEKIMERPMIEMQIERILRSRMLKGLVVATSFEKSDDGIKDLCDEIGIDCFRGSLDDVLDRFKGAVEAYGATDIVRLTGDCPLTDPNLIDEVISFYLEGNYQYASNTIKPTFPDGLDVEVFKRECLEDAWREAEKEYEREHVTPFIYRKDRRYRLGNYPGRKDISHYRWTVDEPADLKFVREIYETLYPQNPTFEMRDILELLKIKPALLNINSGVANRIPTRQK